MQHPNIVQIHEVSEHARVAFVTLEFVGGGSLARLNGTPMPPTDAAQIMATMAGAMSHAHHQGIIHRDLKPANVLLTEAGVAKITDFGLAKKLDDASDQTKSGAVMGTPSYMAPEQADGANKKVGPATDVYALGAILYELLTGRPPFKAATALETLDQVRHEDPVSPRQLQSKIPRDLETICLKCLQKDTGKRYASAEAMADDLRRFHNGEPILARPVSPVEKTWRWCRRNPALAATAGVAVVAMFSLGISSIFAWLGWSEADRQRDAALLAQKEAHASAAYAQQQENVAFIQRRHAEEVVKAPLDASCQVATCQRPRPLTKLRLLLFQDALQVYEEFAQEQGDEPGVRLGVAESAT